MDHKEEMEMNEEIGIREVEENQARSDHMKYLPDMEILSDSDIQEKVIRAMEDYDYTRYTASDVKRALEKEYGISAEMQSFFRRPPSLFLSRWPEEPQKKHRSISEILSFFSHRFIFRIIARTTASTAGSTAKTRSAVPNWMRTGSEERWKPSPKPAWKKS